MSKFNPFTPGQVVGPSMFAGRVNELYQLERILEQTKNGNPGHFLIHGERGVGKSSLLQYMQYVAKGAFPGVNGGKFKFVILNIVLESTNQYIDIIAKVGGELRREIDEINSLKTIASDLLGLLSAFEIYGVRFSKRDLSSVQESELLEELALAIAKSCKRLVGYDGILILLDEVDKPSASANLGTFLKVLTERLATRNCTNVCIGMAGLTEVIGKLRTGHQSATRIIESIGLSPLSTDDSVMVLRRGITASNEKSDVKVTMQSNVETGISSFAGGYPHFLQQFGFSAFEADIDNVIDLADMMAGIYTIKNNALKQLGDVLFENLYYEEVLSPDYRKVLLVMSEFGDQWVTKKTLKDKCKISDSKLRNALVALNKRKIIYPKKGAQGVYKIPNVPFAVWLKLLATRVENPTERSKLSRT